eukprot:914025-Amorphochlora_amoeboformis.AAC.1
MGRRWDEREREKKEREGGEEGRREREERRKKRGKREEKERKRGKKKRGKREEKKRKEGGKREEKERKEGGKREEDRGKYREIETRVEVEKFGEREIGGSFRKFGKSRGKVVEKP